MSYGPNRRIFLSINYKTIREYLDRLRIRLVDEEWDSIDKVLICNIQISAEQKISNTLRRTLS